MASVDLAKVERVLVVKPSSLGDIVHTLPIVQALAKIHAHWQIDWLANTPWLPLLNEHPQLQRVIEFPRKRFSGLGARRFWPWLCELRRSGAYQLALDFQGLQRSALMARFALGEGEAWGLGEVREGAGIWMHQRASALGEFSHAIERYHSLGCLAGLSGEVEDLPAARLPEGNCPVGAEDFCQGEFWIVHPYSRGVGKALEPKLLLNLLQGLAWEQQKRVLLVGQVSASHRLSNLPQGVLDLSNQTSLSELCWLLSRAAGVMSVDSGPMHLAAAFDVPLLGLHAWSDPRLVGPWRPALMDSAWVWKAGELQAWDSFKHPQGQPEQTLNQACVAAALDWAQEN